LRTRRADGLQTNVTNILTIDLEDWFQVSNLDRFIGRELWEACESRLEASTYRLLAILDEAGVKATFFVLGWNAERNERLVREIARCGHEIAVHGYQHALVYEQTPVQFAWELEHCQQLVKSITGRAARGYRAASFSVVRRSLWALELLEEHGFEYDSSIFPIRHHRYGIPDSPDYPYRVAINGHTSFVEFPIPTMRWMGRKTGFSGGAYFRLLPYRMVAGGIKRLNARGHSVVVYLHPWELDPDHPRLPLPWALRLRCYGNLERTEGKLRRLLRDFEFAPVEAQLDRCQGTLPCYRLAADESGLHAVSLAARELQTVAKR
jgi:polysaccharide deacetylase family protein (PEP-CTERM system associated)